jgi:hypothetical protein
MRQTEIHCWGGGGKLSYKNLEIVSLREKLPFGDPVQKACLNAPTVWQQETGSAII